MAGLVIALFFISIGVGSSTSELWGQKQEIREFENISSLEQIIKQGFVGVLYCYRNLIERVKFN